jgi:FkbM family methyltransferase
VTNGAAGARDALDGESTLLSRDLAMLSTAVKYNLAQRSERIRSMKTLVRFFFNLVKILDVDLFVEAGAKDGSASRQAKRALGEHRVVAFEANPYTYRRFEGENAGTGVEYLNLALTDHPGPVTFNVLRDDEGAPRPDGQSSLLKRNRGRDQERGFEEVTVDGVTLDGFFADHPFENAAVWMDVEGASKFVLGGAPETLKRTAVLIIEVEDRPYWGDDHWLRERVMSHLYDNGLVPIARDFEYEYQYNIVFVRADLANTHARLRWELTKFISSAYERPALAARSSSPIVSTPSAQTTNVARRFMRASRRRLGRARAALRQRGTNAPTPS